MGIFFYVGGLRYFFKIDNFFAYTCPNHSRVGAIDNPDRFDDVLHPYYILEAIENFFDTNFGLCILRNWLEIAFVAVFKAFISNFLFYNLY